MELETDVVSLLASQAKSECLWDSIATGLETAHPHHYFDPTMKPEEYILWPQEIFFEPDSNAAVNSVLQLSL